MDWQPHHFITGWLCLDLVNTIIFANTPERRADRLQTAADIEEWRKASGAETGSIEEADAAQILDIRRLLDGYFRALARGGAPGEGDWRSLARLYGAHADALDGLSPLGEKRDGSKPSLAAAALHSGVALAFSDERERLGECGNCGWLFLDRTRNRSKRWCTSHLCGNRAKAKRHYERRKAERHRTVGL